ncbi:hypothetical protein [Burkholderia pyrrocinia]|nr:hypothetical protein [Burkholderia pyrrocinia]
MPTTSKEKIRKFEPGAQIESEDNESIARDVWARFVARALVLHMR